MLHTKYANVKDNIANPRGTAENELNPPRDKKLQTPESLGAKSIIRSLMVFPKIIVTPIVNIKPTKYINPFMSLLKIELIEKKQAMIKGESRKNK
jgi:hypothetical protein